MEQRQFLILLASGPGEWTQNFASALRGENRKILTAEDSKTAFEQFGAHTVDLLILSLELSGGRGEELFRLISGISDVPTVILSQDDSEERQLQMFRLGCDDYLPMPASIPILCARVDALLQRCYTRAGKIKENIQFERLRINHFNRTVYVGGQEVELTKKEFDLLELFVRHPGQVFSRQQLIEHLWADSEINDIRTVDTHIKQLRTKLRECKGYLRTVWGVGYKFSAKR